MPRITVIATVVVEASSPADAQDFLEELLLAGSQFEGMNAEEPYIAEVSLDT